MLSMIYFKKLYEDILMLNPMSEKVQRLTECPVDKVFDAVVCMRICLQVETLHQFPVFVCSYVYHNKNVLLC